mmetsp:Transcript_11380/g.28708  ORF Transcript_11380/g.28708 Transcript_11380/m.28708 type:complete len:358 (+) Transcript_11380:274-1347(+)
MSTNKDVGGWMGQFQAETQRQAEACLASGHLSAEDRTELEEDAQEVLRYMLRPANGATLQGARMAVLMLQMWAIAAGDMHGVYASAWFLRTSMFNHSCRPNCTVHFLPGGGLVVRAIRDIRSGELLHISYIDAAQAVAHRQEDLASFYFRCCCERCRDGEAADMDLELRGLHCPSDSCTAAIAVESPELRCTACGERMPANHHELAHLLRKGAALHVQGHHQYRRESTSAAGASLRKCLTIRSTLLHPCNADLLATRDVAYKAMIAERDWTGAYRCLAQLVDAKRRLAPSCGYQHGRDPFDVVLLLADLARVADQLGEPRKAKRHLQEVRAGLNFACGADSATATDVLNGLANAGLS